MNTLISSPSQRLDASSRSAQNVTEFKTESKDAPMTWMPSMLLQAVTEGWVDGILLLTQHGDLIYGNSHAQRLCQQIGGLSSKSQTLPPEIWHLCEALIESRELFPEQPIVLEDELGDRKCPRIRVRVQWVELTDNSGPCLLVMLEDRLQSLHSLAVSESQKYRLTDREAEVWFRQRTNHTYEEIAAELHISTNTVKKHIKNIRAKREAVWWAEDCN
jgi:DNA-binding CsgD family transcriptional regulator